MNRKSKLVVLLFVGISLGVLTTHIIPRVTNNWTDQDNAAETIISHYKENKNISEMVVIGYTDEYQEYRLQDFLNHHELKQELRKSAKRQATENIKLQEYL